MTFDIKYVAHLARIGLTDGEAAQLEGQLSKILDYVNQLKEVDVSGVAPTTHTARSKSDLRADETRPSLDRDAALANAPFHTEDQFLVPKIIE